jgi:hypothetical protein
MEFPDPANEGQMRKVSYQPPRYKIAEGKREAYQAAMKELLAAHCYVNVRGKLQPDQLGELSLPPNVASHLFWLIDGSDSEVEGEDDEDMPHRQAAE